MTEEKLNLIADRWEDSSSTEVHELIAEVRRLRETLTKRIDVCIDFQKDNQSLRDLLREVRERLAGLRLYDAGNLNERIYAALSEK